MVQELRLFRFVDGVNDTPFPNKEANDEQIVITSFAYNAQRMAATPTITASIDYYRCLDDDWDVNVYAEYKGEKYYIRQIPSSSKSNTSVMYKHDLTLYSERFVLENIYFTDIEKKTENGVDVFVKRETTSITYRFNLIEYVDRLNWSLEASNLPYRVSIDSSILNSDKAKEIKDVSLENAYLANAIQEIYNQWETFFYFNGNNIIIKDCSENINDVVLEYGAENSLLSIKKNNANFRKITRISGYGSDKNIPFYYPNWSQKGVIDAMPLSTNSKLTKSMITITDMKKFDKKMPLNGNVKYLLKSETQPIFSDTTLNKDGLKYKNQTSTKQNFTIPFESKRENNSVVDIYFDVDIYEEVFPTINSQYLYYDIYNASGNEGIQVLADMLHSPVDFGGSFLMPQEVAFTDDVMQNTKVVLKNRIPCTATLESSSFVKTSMNTGNDWKGRLNITRKLRICLTCQSVPKGKYNINIESLFNIAEAIKKQEKIGYYYKNYGTILQKQKDYFATLNQEKNFININLSNFSIVFPESDADEGWYLNETKKIELADIGISVNGTPDDSWNGEGFTQEIVSKIPTAQNLMPSLYRNSIGERKFYNAINYPRSVGSNDQDGASGETLNGLMYENNNYKENGSYYNFETLWTPTNQNEHIQDFEDIYPSITNITNANSEPIDEILEVAFDDNDNNEVDEQGNYIHPYFYVRIPKFDGNNGFNLFDHKIVGGNMQVAMTSGDCAACNFEIMVKTRTSQGNDTYEDVVNPIKLKENGTLVDGDSDKKTAGDFGTEDTTQQDSRNNSIWLVLKKDNETFNEAYPNKLKGVVPKVGDKFVLLNIDMPRSYVLEAEEKLTKEIIKYMSQNNSDKWNFDIDFSRIFLQENQEFYSKLDENCKLNVRYNGITYNFYVNSYKYEVKANEALPKITVGLVDTITVNRGVTQNIVDGVMKAIQQTYDVEESVDNDELYLRKLVPERMPNEITFEKKVVFEDNLEVKSLKTPTIESPLYGGDEVLGTGFKLEENENGESTLTVDNVNVRKKLKATEFVIQQIQFQGGIVIQSAAAMECNQVETLENGNFKCYFDTKEGSVSNQFMLDDLARCQRVGYAPKYYWRKVVEVGSDYIVLSNVVGEYEEGSDTPSAGDIIVQMGNTTNTNRQSAIEMNTVGENSPSFIMYSGITTFSLLEKDTTGIVYHQKVVDANGNVTLEAYPELYSYGSMYFGDRNKQNNFIQFAPNANGTFEMLINAKTSFQGGTSDLGNALDSLLSGVQGAQNTINNLKIGGTNLLLKSNEIVENVTKYLAKGYTYAKQPTVGTYTVQIKGSLGEDRTSWAIHTKSGNYLIVNVTASDLKNGIYTKTFNFGESTIGADDFLLYQRPSTGTSGSYIEWVKLEEGNKPTSWTPAPEDVEQAIADAEDRTMEALANEVVTINGGIDALQKQVDGEVNSWFMEGEPTLNNAPANEWTTDELKQRHEGDTYTDITTFVDEETTPTAGQSWRWCNVDDEYGTGWHWHKIADSDAVKALAEAAKAQSTAGRKSTTFIVQPSNYSKGDLWILASGKTVNGISYKAGTILTANEASTTYIASHWGEKVKYTDDELAKKAEQDAATAQQKADQAQTDATNAKNRLDNWASDSVISPTEKQGIKDEIARIVADKSHIESEYTKYSLGTPTTFNTAYNAYYDVLITLSATEPETIEIPTDFATKQTNYYAARTNALNAISEGAKLYAESYADSKDTTNLVLNTATMEKKTPFSYSGATITKGTSGTINGKPAAYIYTDGGTNKYKAIYDLLHDTYPYFDVTKKHTLSFNIKAVDYSLCIRAKLSKEKGTNIYQEEIYIVAGEEKRVVITGYPFTNQNIQLWIGARYFTNDSTLESYTYDARFYINELKLEQGSVATAWSPNPADIQDELTKITDLQSDFQESLNAINSDEYFSISEKKIIRTDWEAISGINSTSESNSYTTLSGSYGEAYQLANGKVSTQDLTDKFSALRRFLHNQGTKGLYVDEDWNWGANGRKDMSDRFTAYYNAEVALLQAYNDYFAEKQVKDLQIGGVNLVSNIPSNWEQGSFTESKVLGTDYSEVCNYVSSTRIRVKNAIEVKGNIYIKIHNSGYDAAFIQFDEDKKYLGRETYVTWHNDAPHTLHNDTRYICLILRKSNNTTITPNDITNVKIKLEQGNKATAWKPNDADIIEARENILKDAMLFTLNDRALQIDLTKSTESNTEYVFSIENNILPTNTNSVKVRLYDDPQEADYWEDTYLFEFNITSGTKFTQTLIFNASISKLYFNASKANVTLVGVKLAKGNKYTGWEGTPDEQQALITLNNAMKGSTDIIGGLVMTNLIGMKGYGTEASQIKAGISGLNENNNLRFWAGSTAWSNANTAPFRVYDDGRVFGTHFYGYLSATIITSSNYQQYLTSNSEIDLTKTGQIIYLDRTLINVTFYITFPKEERYLGSEVIIINPHKIPLVTCSNVLPPTYGTASNAFTSYPSAAKPSLSPTIGAYYTLEIRKMNVSSIAEVGTSYYPRFTYHSYGQCTRTIITRNYAVLKFRFIETYPLRFITGSASNVPHLLKINTFSGQGYNYNTYAFWCLESETFPITY